MNNSFKLALCCSLLLAATASAHAQDKADCSKIFSAGCGSFNEMVIAKDGGILDAINTEGTAARVCFAEGDDDFVLLSMKLPPPTDAGWHRNKDGPGWSSIVGPSLFTRYKNGVSDKGKCLWGQRDRQD